MTCSDCLLIWPPVLNHQYLPGTETYHQMLAKGLAHAFDAKLLILDITDLSRKVNLFFLPYVKVGIFEILMTSSRSSLCIYNSFSSMSSCLINKWDIFTQILNKFGTPTESTHLSLVSSMNLVIHISGSSLEVTLCLNCFCYNALIRLLRIWPMEWLSEF